MNSYLVPPRIGVDAMFHLLADTSIFVSLPNDSLCQMTGEPIVEKAPPDGKAQDLQKDVNKKRVNAGNTGDEPSAKRLRRWDSALSRSDSLLAVGTTVTTTPQ
jgi:hypothetical protein